MYFKTISNLTKFMRTGVKASCDCIPTIAVWKYVWQLSSTSVGITVLDLYAKSQRKPEEAHDSLCILLQYLQPLLQHSAAIGIDPDNAEAIDKDASLKTVITDAKSRTSIRGMDNVYDYLFECRNMSVHNGQIIETLRSGSREVSIYSLISIERNEGKDDVYKQLCSLVMLSALTYFYGYAQNRANFGWQFVQYPALAIGYCLMYVGKAFEIIKKCISALCSLIGGTIVAVMTVGCFVLILMGIVLVISIIHYFMKKSDDKIDFARANPTELVQWVNDQTPIEQMSYFYDRRSSLYALGDFYGYGDTIRCKADERTAELYQWAIDNKMPNQRAWYYQSLPNIPMLARVPVLGLIFTMPGEPEIFMHTAKKASQQEKFYMPIYDEGYYSLIIYYPNDTYDRADRERALATMCKKYAKELAKYPTIEYLILYGTYTSGTNIARDKKHSELTLHTATLIKKSFTAAGIPSSRIKIVERNTKTDVVVAIKGIPVE